MPFQRWLAIGGLQREHPATSRRITASVLTNGGGSIREFDSDAWTSDSIGLIGCCWDFFGGRPTGRFGPLGPAVSCRRREVLLDASSLDDQVGWHGYPSRLFESKRVGWEEFQRDEDRKCTERRRWIVGGPREIGRWRDLSLKIHRWGITN